MANCLFRTRALWAAHLPPLWAVGMSVMLSLAPSGVAFGQEIRISGTVTSSERIPLGGVTVRVQGSDTRALTDAAGRYTIAASGNGILSFSRIGHRAVQENIAGRTRIDVTMTAVAFLEEVVVTAYTTERRADITGAVASVNVDAVARPGSFAVAQAKAAATICVDATDWPGVVRAAGIRIE